MHSDDRKRMRVTSWYINMYLLQSCESSYWTYMPGNFVRILVLINFFF